MEAILAKDKENGISKEGKIAWNIREDMKFFRELTISNVVIMGRKTYESLGKKGLKKRLNIVLTRGEIEGECIENSKVNIVGKYNGDNVIFSNNYLEIKKYLMEKKKEVVDKFKECELNEDYKIILIGGKEIYEKYILDSETIWVTNIKVNYNCDLFLNIDLEGYKSELIIDKEEYNIIKYSKK